MKRKQDCFSTYHPLLNFCYFTVVLLITMFLLQPYFLAVSFTAALAYALYLNGAGALKFNLIGMVPLFVLMVVGNAFFNHAGVTILVYVNGNPWTLEAMIFGVVAALMFVAVLNWFSCYNAIMTTDKFIYLFGRIIPKLSLILSMIFRFIPKYKAQIQKISHAQRCIGRDITNGRLHQKLRHGIKILSIMITWALEDGIDTADSMQSRGYGLPGRTSFAMFRFDARDWRLLALLTVLTAFILVCVGTGQLFAVYYPAIKINSNGAVAVAAYVGYGLLCFLPLLIDIADDLRWRYQRRVLPADSRIVVPVKAAVAGEEVKSC